MNDLRRFNNSLHEVSVVFVACMAQFLSQAGVTMAICNMNIITESFVKASGIPVNNGEKVWFMGSYSLVTGTFIMFSGRLGDIFGLKFIFLIGWAWSALWSLVVGISYYSNSLTFFIISRAFQGLGIALLLPCGIGLLGVLYPTGKRKNIVFGFVGACGPGGATIGAIFSTLISQLGWWPWAFWIFSIVALACGILAFFVIPHVESSNDHVGGFKDALQKLDVVGTVFGVAGLILLNFVWNQSAVVGWDSAYIIVLLIVSVLCLGFFLIFEVKYASYPLIPKEVFNVHIGSLLSCVGLGWGSFGIWQYYYCTISLNLRHYTAIELGLTYIPLLVFGIMAAFSSSFLISKISPSFIICFSMLSFMSGCLMLSVMPVHQSFFRISMGLMFILSWGMDLSFPSSSILISDYLPPKHQGMAASLVTTVVNYSVSLFIGIGSTVETQVFLRTKDVLGSYRAALYFGIGTAGLGVTISLSLIILHILQRRDDKSLISDILPAENTLELDYIEKH